MTAREAIHAALKRSHDPDPRVVGRRCIPRYTPEQAQEILAWGSEELAAEENRLARMDGSARATETRGSSRWKNCLPDRVFVRGTRMMLDECGLEELLALADDYRMRGEQMLAKEREFREMAGELERSGCATVGEMRTRTGQKVAA